MRLSELGITGLNVTVTLGSTFHLGCRHAGSGGGLWNQAWRNWLELPRLKNTETAWRFVEDLMNSFGIGHLFPGYP